MKKQCDDGSGGWNNVATTQGMLAGLEAGRRGTDSHSLQKEALPIP